jgi:hypothetical protein
VLVDLSTGGQALLLAESMSVPDFIGAMEDVRDDTVHTQGSRVMVLTSP